MSRRTDNKHRYGKSRLGNILIVAQFVISGFLMLMILKLSVMPVKMLLIVALIVLLLLGLTVNGLRLGRHRKLLRITTNIIAVMVIMSFTLLSVFLVKSDSFIKEVAGDTEERFGVSVIVMQDSTAETLADLDNAVFGYVDGTGSVMYEKGIREIKSEIGQIETIHPDNLIGLADMLYSGKCDAVIIEETGRPLITESHQDFEEKTRTIWNREFFRMVEAPDGLMDVTQDSFNIFLCGSDSRNSVEEVALNDLNMIVTVNPVTKQILLTSIPRDYYLELASYGAKDKLTHAGIFGTEEAMKTVEKFTGINMDFYVKVSFAALVYVVDAIGGIDIESDTEFTAWTNPEVHIEKGMNHLDGVKTLAYARERFAYEDGDIHRAQNQAQVMREIANKASSPEILIHYDKLLDALAKGMKTSMSDTQIKSIIRMQLESNSRWDIIDYQMRGKDAMSKECYSMWGTELYIMEPDEATVEEALKNIEDCMNGEKTAVPGN